VALPGPVSKQAMSTFWRRCACWLSLPMCNNDRCMHYWAAQLLLRAEPSATAGHAVMCMLLFLQAQKADHSSDSLGRCRRGSCLLLVSSAFCLWASPYYWQPLSSARLQLSRMAYAAACLRSLATCAHGLKVHRSGSRYLRS
jgi:hypothetical protein